MNEQPLVSAIITTCRRPRLVGRAIDSVFSQTYPNIECIVVNDGDDAETSQVLADKKSIFPSMKVFNQPRQSGLSAARNLGMRLSAGNFVAFLDDDDVWLSDKIALQVAEIERQEDQCGLVYCWFEFRNGDRVVGARKPDLAGDVFQKVLVSQPLGNGSTFLARKSAAAAVGGFDEDLARGIDGDFVRRLAAEYRVGVVPEVQAHIYVGHEYERITTDDLVGLERALRGHEVKFEKFPWLEDRYPSESAHLHSIISVQKFQLGDIRGCVSSALRALRLRPYSPFVLRNLAKVPVYGWRNFINSQ